MRISVIFARGLLSEVQSRGLDSRLLLEHSHVDAARLADLRETLSLEEFDVLVREAMRMTGDPGLGLSVGAHAPENMLQVFGQLVLAQSTIREAFGVLRRYATLLADDLSWGLFERGDTALFTVESAVQLGDSTRYALEHALTMAARIGLHFAPPGTGLHEVQVQYAAPSYAARYKNFFMCETHFDQPVNALLFPRALLDRPQFHADDTVRTVLAQTAEKLLQERVKSRSLAERVRTLLRYQRDLQAVDIDRMARDVGLSPRALRRQLGAEGAPLSMLLDEARCRIACDELRRSDSTIKETADLLGFSEPSAFHRAFKRWTGRTPADYSRHA